MSLLAKLNKVLENQLDVLNSADLVGDELDEEIRRIKSINEVSKQIVSVNRLALDAIEVDLEYGGDMVDKGLLTVSGDKKVIGNGEG